MEKIPIMKTVQNITIQSRSFGFMSSIWCNAVEKESRSYPVAEFAINILEEFKILQMFANQAAITIHSLVSKERAAP